MADRARLASLPKVDEVLRRPELEGSGLPRWALADAVRAAIDERRRAILEGRDGGAVEVASDEVLALARALLRPSLRPVINATGVVLHTNLGRAPLADAAVARLVEVARGYSNLEYVVDARRARLAPRPRAGAPGSPVSAPRRPPWSTTTRRPVLVSLAALAAGREVVVSRGELIEIGGSFRVPDVMRQSGARLVEVGTTNKTHRRDYEAACGRTPGCCSRCTSRTSRSSASPPRWGRRSWSSWAASAACR
jgi:L-seryl-tRNA(Ser) seleniumtransferase